MSFDLSPVRVAQLLQPHAELVLEHLAANEAPDDIVRSAQAICDLNQMISTLDNVEAVLKLQGAPGAQGYTGPPGIPGRDGAGINLNRHDADKMREMLVGTNPATDDIHPLVYTFMERILDACR